MCCVSVLSFVSQLYVTPPVYAKQCDAMATRFMHGPRFWLHGEGGDVCFRAGLELGLKASPKCPQAVSLALCFQGSARHQADYASKIEELEIVGYGHGCLEFKKCQQII